MIRRIPNRVCRVSETTRRWLKSPGFVAKASTTANKQTNSRTFAKPRKIASDAHISLRGVSPRRSLSLVLQVPSIALRVPSYNRWHRGLPGGTPGPTTIIICTKLCAHRYISRVRLVRVLIFMYQAKVGSLYNDGRSCPICTRCFHRCSARIPTITSIVG